MEIVRLPRRGELTPEALAYVALCASWLGVVLVGHVVDGIPPRGGSVHRHDDRLGGLVWLTFVRSGCAFLLARSLGTRAFDDALGFARLHVIVAALHGVVAIVALHRALGVFNAYAFAATLIVWPIWLLRDCERWRASPPLEVARPPKLPVARLRP